MYRIIDKASSGKTSRLLLLAKENDGVVVCLNPVKLREKAFNYGITGVEIISYEDYMNGNYRSSRVFIDEVDSFFRFYDPYITGYTLNED